MRLSIHIKFNEKKLKKFSPNLIYEYAELIEIFREHGFVHRNGGDIGFINENATKEDAEKAIGDAAVRLHWVQDTVTECEISELGERRDFTSFVAEAAKKKSK